MKKLGIFLISSTLAVSCSGAGNSQKKVSQINSNGTSGATTPIGTMPMTQRDTDLNALVRDDLGSLSSGGSQNITVLSNSGVVTLEGTVRSRADADALVQRARGNAGVNEVISKIKIDPNMTY